MERFRRCLGQTQRQRWDNGLAERVASLSFNPDFHPEHWNLIFKNCKKALSEHVAEYGDRP